MLVAVAQLTISHHASAFCQSREQNFPRPIVGEQQKFQGQKFATKSCKKTLTFLATFLSHQNRCNYIDIILVKNRPTFDLILVWAQFFFYCSRNFGGRHDILTRAATITSQIGASRVASIHTRRSAPVHAQDGTCAVRCPVVTAHMGSGYGEKSYGTSTSLRKLN